MLTLLLQPSFLLNNSLTRLKNTFRETFRLRKKYRHSFERKIWLLHEHFYRRQSRSMIPSVSEPTRMLTLLLQPSFHLKKSSTTLKNTFHETAYQHSFERKIWQLHEYFYHRQPRSMIPSVSAPTRMLTLLLQPSFYLKKSSTTLKNTFHETANPHSFERKIWQRQEYFFRRQRDQ